MLLNQGFRYIKNWKIKGVVLLLTVLISVFIVFFLKPFKTAQNDKSVLLGYCFFIFLAYFLALVVEYFLFKKKRYWTVKFEIIFNFILFLIGTLGVYWYDLVVVKQVSFSWDTFFSFIWRVTLPFGLLLTAFVLFLRYYFGKIYEQPNLHVITLIGTLKSDVFKTDLRNILYIKSSNNYVEIFYETPEKIKSKLIRSSLTNIQQQIPSFIKCHRSYLINPQKINSITGTKKKPVLVLTNVIEVIPISSSYYEKLNLYISQQKK